ncbi:MAG: flagellar biosynthesis anti-sigma factor FlgM [Solimonas sp.]
MTTKINGGSVDSYAPLAHSQAAPAARAGGTPTAAAVSPVPQQDSLSLTDDALLLQQTAAAASAASGVDQGRIDAISRQIGDGSYRADAQTIAARLMKSETEIYG